MLHSKTLFSEVKASFDLSIVLSVKARKPTMPNFGWQWHSGLVPGCTCVIV